MTPAIAASIMSRGAPHPGSSGLGPAKGGQNLPPLLRQARSRASQREESSWNV